MNQADHKMYFMNDCDKKLKKSLPKQSKKWISFIFCRIYRH